MTNVNNVLTTCDFNEDGIVDSTDLTILEMSILGLASLDANQAFLDTVTYLDYELTGEKVPCYIGRWWERKSAVKTTW